MKDFIGVRGLDPKWSALKTSGLGLDHGVLEHIPGTTPRQFPHCHHPC